MTDGYAATMLLAKERPDLLPVLRRIAAAGGQGWFFTEDPEDLEELARRGLIVRAGADDA